MRSLNVQASGAGGADTRRWQRREGGRAIAAGQHLPRLGVPGAAQCGGCTRGPRRSAQGSHWCMEPARRPTLCGAHLHGARAGQEGCLEIGEGEGVPAHAQSTAAQAAGGGRASYRALGGSPDRACGAAAAWQVKGCQCAPPGGHLERGLLCRHSTPAPARPGSLSRLQILPRST